MVKMKTPKFTPIAMRCNQEQFDKIEPKLKKAELVLGSCVLNESWPYLINHYHDDDLDINKPSIGSYVATRNAKEIYEEWNENIFLEACGIEVKEPKEKTYKITREQIKEIHGHSKPYGEIERKLKEWFPEVFETKLEVGKWYWSHNRALWCVEAFESSQRITAYGFNAIGDWSNSMNRQPESLTEATEQEVTEALIKDAVRRGYNTDKPTHFNYKNGTGYLQNPSKSDFLFRDGILYLWDIKIFEDGQWAEILETISKHDAEKLLNKKIV